MNKPDPEPLVSPAASTRPNRRALLVGSGALAAIGGAGLFAWQQRSAEPSPMDALWTLSLPTPDGSTLALRTLQGQGLVVNFWATWCAPCVRELPALDDFAQRHRNKGWRVLGLAIDQMTAVQGFLKRIPVTYPVAIAGFEAVAWSRALGNDQGGLPHTVVLSPAGHVLASVVGETTRDKLEAIAFKT
jgi:thiol-disulfide isomerase/thioredoxin